MLITKKTSEIDKINEISTMILDDIEGIYNKASSLELNLVDITNIKNAILLKSKNSTGYEKDLFYKIYLKINTSNYINIFKSIDRYFSKKNKEYTASLINENTYSFTKRKSQSITVSNHNINGNIIEDIKSILKNHVYTFNHSSRIVDLYLRNKIEYNQNLSNILAIKNALTQLSVSLNIHFLCEYKMINNMSKLEKKEFIDFIDNY